MTPEEFVDCFVAEKKNLLREWLSGSGGRVAEKIAELQLPPASLPLVAGLLDAALTDAFYTILLGLDGQASIGGKQQLYQLRDQEGNELTGGEIEGYAWERLQGPSASAGP